MVTFTLILTRQGCRGNSSLHLEDFTDHSFGFLKEFFSGLGLKEHNLCIAPAQILTVNVFANVAKNEAQSLKPFHYVRYRNLFIH